MQTILVLLTDLCWVLSIHDLVAASVFHRVPLVRFETGGKDLFLRRFVTVKVNRKLNVLPGVVSLEVF